MPLYTVYRYLADCLDGICTEKLYKESEDLINIGAYVKGSNEEIDLAVEKNKAINTFEVSEYWSDIGTIEQYKKSLHDVIQGHCKFNHDSIFNTETGSYISKNKIDAHFIGISAVGENCVIGKNVTIDNCIIWDNVRIADNVCIKNSIIASNEVIACDIVDKIIAANKVVKY